MRNHGIWNLEVSCFWTNPYGYIYIYMYGFITFMPIFQRRPMYVIQVFLDQVENSIWIPAFLLSLLFSFFAFLLLCFSVFRLFCFASLLFCFSFFFLFLLSVFSCFSAVLAFSFLLLCFVRFLLFLLLCFCAFLRLLVFFFSLFSPVCILNETLDETQRPPKEIPIRNPT